MTTNRLAQFVIGEYSFDLLRKILWFARRKESAFPIFDTICVLPPQDSLEVDMIALG